MQSGEHRDKIVAIEIDIVEGSSESAPSGHVTILDANDMGCGPEAHTAAAQGTLNQRDLKLDGGSGRDIARSQEINAAGANIFGDERDGRGLRATLDAGQLQRQAQTRARATSAIFRNANGMGRHSQKVFVVQVGTDLMDFPSASINGSYRELQFRKCPHVEPPKSRPSQAEIWNYA